MRCKKHPSDISGSVGVCASCLRERLLSLIAAQAQAQSQSQSQAHLSRVASRASVASDEYSRKSDSNLPPPLIFPRSVSPYVSRRKSDYATWQGCDRRDRLFYSTPQVGPTYYGGDGVANLAFDGKTASCKKRPGRFWIFSNMFRSRSEKYESGPRVSSRDSCEPSSSASPSWLSMIFPARRRNLSKMNSFEDSTVKGRKLCRQVDRGMSPVTTEDFTDDCDGNTRSLGSGYSSESSPGWRKTPAMAPPSTRHSRRGKNVSGMSFCLSPLVRASPNRHWNHKGLPPELNFSGEIRATAKPHLSTAASFCANRSRKLADFGRFNQNR